MKEHSLFLSMCKSPLERYGIHGLPRQPRSAVTFSATAVRCVNLHQNASLTGLMNDEKSFREIDFHRMMVRMHHPSPTGPGPPNTARHPLTLPQPDSPTSARIVASLILPEIVPPVSLQLPVQASQLFMNCYLKHYLKYEMC